MTCNVLEAMRLFVYDLHGAPGLDEPGNVTWTRAQRYYPELGRKLTLASDLTPIFTKAYNQPPHMHDAAFAAAQLAVLQVKFLNYVRAHDAMRIGTYTFLHCIADLCNRRLRDKLRATRIGMRRAGRIRRRPHQKAVDHNWLQ